MQIIKQLENYYGEFKDEYTKKTLLKLVDGFDDKELEDFFNKVVTANKKSFGMPDVSAFDEVVKTVTRTPKAKSFWKVCNDCGCEYDYEMAACPECYKQGYDCRSYTVKVSEFNPPAKIISFNYTEIIPAEYMGNRTCYKCADNFSGKCKHFGLHGKVMQDGTVWECRETRDCPCYQCCVMTRAKNDKLMKSKVTYSDIMNAHKNGKKIENLV